jgi:hypothetical protein
MIYIFQELFWLVKEHIRENCWTIKKEDAEVVQKRDRGNWVYNGNSKNQK